MYGLEILGPGPHSPAQTYHDKSFNNGGIAQSWRGDHACLCSRWRICREWRSFLRVPGKRRWKRAARICSSVPLTGAQVLVVPADVRDAQAVNAAVQATRSRFQRVNKVIANAGTSTGLSERTSILQLQIRRVQSISHVA